MSTELMTAKNSSGTISMTGYYREGKPRYQITVHGAYDDIRMITSNRAMYVEVDAETIANMQRCVNNYETPEI